MSGLEQLAGRAYALAYFIHPEKARAIAIAGEALARLSVTAAVHEKRGTYSPRDGFKRTKVRLGSRHLVQWLVLHVSESYEVADERAGLVSADDLIVRFIKHVALHTIAHNSFYACVAATRVLCEFPTEQALDMYAAVAENRPKDDSGCRRVKARFMRTLRKLSMTLRVRRER